MDVTYRPLITSESTYENYMTETNRSKECVLNSSSYSNMNKFRILTLNK